MPRFETWIASRPCAALVVASFCLLLSAHAFANTVILQPWSGADGLFDTVRIDGKAVYRSRPNGPGTYSGLMYFKRPAGVSFPAGATLYLEVDFKDVGGRGRFGVHYDAQTGDYQAAAFAIGSSVQNTGEYRTAVFRLDRAELAGGENGGSDLRLNQPGPMQLHVIEVRVSDQPSPLFERLTQFLGPYTGPKYAGGTAVDATTMRGKLLCGYQGWFRTPGDDDDTGFQHYIADWGGAMRPDKIAIDYWPDTSELGASERHPAAGFTHPDGTPAILFSSDDARSVLRHFQWMEAYGIDGVALQRFMPGPSPDLPTLRVMSHVRAAANLTGRVFFVEYDMTGAKEADLVPTLTRDWRMLVDTLAITADDRYLKQDGLPVVGIFGFYRDRFSLETAHAILDIFEKPGRYRAFVAGAGAWYWNIEPYPEAWKSVIYRMGSWQPWNTGNAGGKPTDTPNTAYWAADQSALAAHGVMYVPQIFPGGSDFNRSHRAWVGDAEHRQRGAFLWAQVVQATRIKAASVFLGMFDEMDEGTQIFKVSTSPPAQAHFRGYEGLPSDAYLCFTGEATRMLRGETPLRETPPDCAAKTQPSIPDAIEPLDGAKAYGHALSYRWTDAIALAKGGTIDHYEVRLDGVTSRVNGTVKVLDTRPGRHVWRVRAVSSLGNAGGWSVAQTFVVLAIAAPGAGVTPPRRGCSCQVASPAGELGAIGFAALGVIGIARSRRRWYRRRP